MRDGEEKYAIEADWGGIKKNGNIGGGKYALVKGCVGTMDD